MRILVFLGLGLAVSCGGSAFTSSDGNGSAGAHSAGSASVAGAGAGGAVSGAGGSVDSGGQAGLSGGNPGGSAGASNQAGSAGASGSGPTCAELYTRASKELEAATVCNPAAAGQQCTGKVTEPCGCERPVESTDSLETKAYLATIAQIQKKKCTQACPAIACLATDHAQCSVTSGSTVAHCSPLFPPAL